MTNSENPYATPDSFIADLEAGEYYQPTASSGKRFLNYVIDSIVSAGFNTGVGYAIALISEMGITDAPLDFINGADFTTSYILGFLLGVIFYTMFEALGGRTPGKWLTGTKAVMANNDKVSFGTALLRSLCRWIPFEIFSFLSRSGGWHDRITGTKVIDLRAQPWRKRQPQPALTLPPGAIRISVPRPAPPRQPRPAPKPVFRPGPVKAKPGHDEFKNE